MHNCTRIFVARLNHRMKLGSFQRVSFDFTAAIINDSGRSIPCQVRFNADPKRTSTLNLIQRVLFIVLHNIICKAKKLTQQRGAM